MSMLISHKHKFVFVSVHKTGSTSVRRKLYNYADIHGSSSKYSSFYYHTSSDILNKRFEHEGWDWNNYFKFGFVRNSWDRIVSGYFYRKKMVETWSEKCPKKSEHIFDSFKQELEIAPTFEKYITECIANPHHPKPKNQYTYLTDENNNINVDYVGRTENMQNCFNHICQKIGIENTTLPVVNKTKHLNYNEYYIKKTRDIVADVYAEDIKIFKFKFGE